MKKTLITASIALAFALGVSAQSNVFEVNAAKPGAEIAGTMYGQFFEDINFGADGGLYGELVMNRSFEFPQTLMGWQTAGNVSINTDGPFKRCPHYVVLSPTNHKERHTAIINNGFFGIGVLKGEDYRFTVWTRAPKGATTLSVQLIDPASQGEQQQFAEAKLEISNTDWQKKELVLHSDRTLEKAQLRIFLTGGQPASLEHVSLFPVNTFNKRTNGLRRDLVHALKDMHPGVFRFPGGCIVEGVDLATRYNWKNTIGPVENRPLNENRWQYTFTSRFYPTYYQTNGLGFFEYFQICEDIGAEPLPVLNVGMACQYQNWDNEKAHVPVDSLQPYIQDCLDLIEFANGDVSTTWGAKRAEMGHPEPFNMKYIAVGNEQWGEFYYKRLEPFVKAIKARYPKIQLIGSSGPNSEGKDFDEGWKAMRRLKADLVDEHFYRPEAWFLSQGLRYDKYDRRGPKVFAGEYACHGKGKKRNHFNASLCEAAFMTGMERNADIVRMATYAPLFAHIEGWQWRPDLIWFDNTRVFKSVSYYVQQLFAENKGTNVLKLTMNGKPVAGQEGQNGLFASSVIDKNNGTVIIKVANTSSTEQSLSIHINGLKKVQDTRTLTLSSTDPDAENTLDEPEKIIPQEGKASVSASKKGSTLSDNLPAKSFRVYILSK